MRSAPSVVVEVWGVVFRVGREEEKNRVAAMGLGRGVGAG